MRWPRGSTLRAAPRRLRMPVCGRRDAAISAGARSVRCGSSSSSIRISAMLRSRISHRHHWRAVEQLDVGTVLKAAQAVSGEIVLDKLIKKLLRIAVEHAGAERGLLILFSGDEPRIVAEATTGRGHGRSHAARDGRIAGRHFPSPYFIT